MGKDNPEGSTLRLPQGEFFPLTPISAAWNGGSPVKDGVLAGVRGQSHRRILILFEMK